MDLQRVLCAVKAEKIELEVRRIWVCCLLWFNSITAWNVCDKGYKPSMPSSSYTLHCWILVSNTERNGVKAEGISSRTNKERSESEGNNHKLRSTMSSLWYSLQVLQNEIENMKESKKRKIINDEENEVMMQTQRVCNEFYLCSCLFFFVYRMKRRTDARLKSKYIALTTRADPLHLWRF